MAEAKYEASYMAKEKPNTKGPNCIQRFTSAFQAKVTGTIERGFQRYGEFVGRHHWKVSLASLLFGIACSSLIPFMYEERDNGLDLWLPTESDFGRRSRLLNKEFGSGDKGRVASILVVAKNGTSVLSADNMRRIYALRNHVTEVMELETPTNTYKWSDLCQRQSVSFREGSQPADKANFPDEVCASEKVTSSDNDKYVCVESHVFEIWAVDGEFIHDSEEQKNLNDKEVLDAINSVKISGMTGEDFSASTFLGVSDKDKDDLGNIESASAMVLNFVLSYQEQSKEFETVFLNYFRDKDKNGDFGNFKDVDGVLEVYPRTARSYKDVTQESESDDQQLFIYGYGLVAIYVMFMLGKFSLAEQRVFLALVGILSVILGIGTSYGLCSLFGIWGSLMNMIMPFMLLGIGIDDMFVIVQNFDTLDDDEKLKSRPERMGLTMKHGGVAITITTVTDIMAFGIGATTVLPALSHFCIYATFGIFFVYFYMITFFFGIFVLDVKRSDNMKYGSLFFWRKEPQLQPEPTNFSCLTKGFHFFSKYLLTLPGRIIALSMTIVLLGFAIWGISQLKADFDQNIFVPPGTYLRDYMEKKDELFPSSGMWGAIYIVDVPEVHSKMDVAKTIGYELSQMSSLAEISGLFGFTVSFERFVNKTIGADKGYPNMALEKTQFYELLAQFLYTEGESHRDSLRFKDDLTCNTEAPELYIFSIPYRHKKYADTEEYIEEINKINDFADGFKPKFDIVDSKSADIFPMSDGYFDYVTVDTITGELYRNILLALVCIFIATLFLIADLFASIIVCVSVLFALIDLGGFMHFWGLNIDTLAAILITIALGLSVDYSAHIAHAFMVATGTKKERATAALVDIGPAVLNGGFSTFLAFALLMTSQSIIFTTFFKIFFLVVTFGLYHGLVFLPVILSFIGPASSTRHQVSKNAIGPDTYKQAASASVTRHIRAKSAYSASSARTRTPQVRAKSAFSISARIRTPNVETDPRPQSFHVELQ